MFIANRPIYVYIKNIHEGGGGVGVTVSTISIYYDEKSCIFLGPKSLQFS